MATLPTNIPGYETEEELRQFAAGSLFRAFKPSENAGIGRHDLLLVANPTLASDVNAVEAVRARLEDSEGTNNSGILASFGAINAKGSLVLVSEWCPGSTLAALHELVVTKDGKWPIPAALYLASEIAKTLCFIQEAADPVTGHPHGLVHGQITPETIFLSYSGQIKLISLGMAELENYALQKEKGFRAGLSNYISPELATGREFDGRSDFFSLGILLWELIVGKPAYPASTRPDFLSKLIDSEIPPPSQVRSDVPKELDAVVQKLIDRDKYQRYALGEKAAQEMAALLKFRYPDFKPADFHNLVKKHFEPLRASYLESMGRMDGSSDVTKVTETAPSPAPAQVAPESTGIAMAEPSAPQPIQPLHPQRPRRPRPQASNIAPPTESFFLSSRFLKLAGVIGVCCLIALPFMGTKVIRHYKARQYVPQEKLATLHVISNDSNFQIIVNGKQLDVVDSRVDVPANKDLKVRAIKDGYVDITLDAHLSPDEDLDFPLQFKLKELSE